MDNAFCLLLSTWTSRLADCLHSDGAAQDCRRRIFTPSSFERISIWRWRFCFFPRLIYGDMGVECE